MGNEELLASVPLFSKVDKPDIERMARAVVPRSYKAGETIVNEGEQAVAFYIIASGRVVVRKGDTELNTLGSGECFGEMALLDGYPRATSVVALEDTELLAMTRWDFTAELRTNPTIAVAMLPVLSKRIRKLEGEEVR
jgi:CRP/FNR family cyclic AMP-dependent transcriptional regulator